MNDNTSKLEGSSTFLGIVNSNGNLWTPDFNLFLSCMLKWDLIILTYLSQSVITLQMIGEDEAVVSITIWEFLNFVSEISQRTLSYVRYNNKIWTYFPLNWTNTWFNRVGFANSIEIHPINSSVLDLFDKLPLIFVPG